MSGIVEKIDQEESRRAESLRKDARKAHAVVRISAANLSKASTRYQKSGVIMGGRILGIYDPIVAGDMVRKKLLAQEAAIAYRREEALNCRILMANKVWKVPKAQRPKVLPPPREWTPQERMVDRTINPLNGMGAARSLRFAGSRNAASA